MTQETKFKTLINKVTNEYTVPYYDEFVVRVTPHLLDKSITMVEIIDSMNLLYPQNKIDYNNYELKNIVIHVE